MMNREIAAIFTEIADLLEIKGDNPFRIRAYRRAALAIENLDGSVEEIPKSGLLEIPGIGRDLAAKIEEYERTGKIGLHQALAVEIPRGLLPLLHVPGLGPKTARMLYEKLMVRNVDDLEKLAAAHRLVGLPGIQEKTEEKILRGIAAFRSGRVRH
jgi:DNA polymerase (family 10)